MSRETTFSAEFGKSLLYFVSGMWCTTCARTVQQRVERVSSVRSSTLSFATKLMTVELQDGVDLDQADATIQEIVQNTGFSVHRQKNDWVQTFQEDMQRERKKVISPVAFALMFFLAMWSSTIAFVGYVGGLDEGQLYWVSCWSAMFGIPAILLGLRPFTQAGVRALVKSRTLTLDLFIALGGFSAASITILSLWSGKDHNYSDSGSMVLLVLLAAKMLESNISDRLSGHVLSCVHQAQAPIEVFRKEAWQRRELAQIRNGEKVRFRAGETASIDGRLASSEAIINEHLLSGESRPVALQAGDLVYAGSVARSDLHLVVSQNLGGRLIDRWAETVLTSRGRPHRFSKTIEVLESNLVKFALLGASLVGFIRYQDSGSLESGLLAFFIGILLFCPCLFASILPMATQLAQLSLRKIGVLLYRPECLFDLPYTEHVYLDKTGTLTAVESAYVETDPIHSSKVRAVLSQVARLSSHPVLNGLNLPLEALDLTVHESQIEDFPGQGIKVFLEDKNTLCLGRPEFVRSSIGARSTPLQDDPNRPLVAWNKQIVGHLVTQQSFNQSGLAFLHRLACESPLFARIDILTGDPDPTQAPLFEKLAPGRIHYHQNLSPQEKADQVRGASLFVGDGLNDILALSRATVSCRIGSRSSATTDSDMYLKSQDLFTLMRVLDYSKKFLRVLRQTAFLALTYNVIAWSLAAFGLFSPLGAVSAMLTSLLVLMLSCSRLWKIE